MVAISVVDTFTATSVTTITRSGLDFGANDTGRIIIVAFSFASSVARHIVSVTIGGVTATVAQDTTGGADVITGAAIYYAAPSGTSGQSVVVAFDFAVSAYSSVIYRGIAASAVPVGGGVAAAAATTVTISTVVSNPGFVIESGRAQSTPGISVSYDGINVVSDDLNGVVSGNTYMQSHGSTTEAATRNLGYTGGPGTNSKIIASASWAAVVSAANIKPFSMGMGNTWMRQPTLGY